MLASLVPAGGAPTTIEQALTGLENAQTPEQLRTQEALAAVAYWEAWREVPVQFVRKDLSRVPDHWRTFGRRQSPLSGKPMKAINPANALLNYLYALLEAEARIALLTLGLDPGMGLLHADQKARDSLALDIMEPVRPQVDGYLFELLQTHVFKAKDFGETSERIAV